MRLCGRIIQLKSAQKVGRKVSDVEGVHFYGKERTKFKKYSSNFKLCVLDMRKNKLSYHAAVLNFNLGSPDSDATFRTDRGRAC